MYYNDNIKLQLCLKQDKRYFIQQLKALPLSYIPIVFYFYFVCVCEFFGSDIFYLIDFLLVCFFVLISYLFILFFLLFLLGERKYEAGCIGRWGGSGRSGGRGNNIIKIYYIKKFKLKFKKRNSLFWSQNMCDHILGT